MPEEFRRNSFDDIWYGAVDPDVERDDEAYAAEEDGKKDLDDYHKWDAEQRRKTENGEMRN